MYFTKKNGQIQETIQKSLLAFNRMLTSKSASTKRIVNPSIMILFHDHCYPQQQH